MSFDRLFAAYMDAAHAAATTVDAAAKAIPTARRPYLQTSVAGEKKARGAASVGSAHREISDPGRPRTTSAHATLAYKAAKAVWDAQRATVLDQVENAANRLLAALMEGPRNAKRAILHTSIAPNLVLAQLSLTDHVGFEPAHAIDIVQHPQAWATLMGVARAKPSPKTAPIWKVTTFLHPMDHMRADDPDGDDNALCVEHILSGMTVTEAVANVALTGVNAIFEPDRLEDLTVWKSLERDDAAEFAAFLAQHSAPMSHA